MRVEFDAKGLYITRFPLPRAVDKIYGLANVFLAREDGLSVSARTAFTEDIRALTERSGQLLDRKSSGETQRLQSSEEVKQLDLRAQKLSKQIQALMAANFGDTPAQAGDWGFSIRQTGPRKGTILLPTGREAILEMLDKYVETEEGRPAVDRFKKPVLSEVRSVRDGLRQNVGTRQSGATQRKASTKESVEAAMKLLDLLQGGAVQIILKQYDAKVTPDLALWGFEVVARTRSAKKPPRSPQ